MVMTGIRMGLRASDVINLKLTDIDWRRRSISIIQEKTKTSLTLPMPVPVGNAIYRYIKEDRMRLCPLSLSDLHINKEGRPDAL